MSEALLVPPYHYCPSCSGNMSQSNQYRQVCASCGIILYHNSSPCVGALPIDGSGSIALARRAIEPYRGDWNTIGGFLKYGEDPIEGLKREVMEETGSECRVESFITMNSGTYGPGGIALLNTYFIVHLLSHDLHPQDDVSELKWFDLNGLPENIAFESDRLALSVLKTKLSHP